MVQIRRFMSVIVGVFMLSGCGSDGNADAINGPAQSGTGGESGNDGGTSNQGGANTGGGSNTGGSGTGGGSNTGGSGTGGSSNTGGSGTGGSSNTGGSGTGGSSNTGGSGTGEACRCDYWGTQSAITSVVQHNVFAFPRMAFNGTDRIAILAGGNPTASPYADGRISFSLRDLEGKTVGTDQIISDGSLSGVGWNGSGWVVAWAELDSSSKWKHYVAVLDSGGSKVLGPKPIDKAGGMTTLGGETYFAHGSSIVRYDSSFSPIGTPIELQKMSQIVEITSHDDAISVLGVGEPGSTVYHGLIRGGSLVSEVALQLVATEKNQLRFARAAQDTSGTAVCWAWKGGVSCRYVDNDTGMPMGPAFVVDPNWTVSIDLVRASCAMALVTGLQFMDGPAGYWQMIHFDQTGDVEIKTFDRLWVQPSQAMRVFATKAGGLVRVMPAPRDPNAPPKDSELQLMISKLTCRDVPEPVDCNELNALMEQYMCHTCSKPGSSIPCRYKAGSYGQGKATYTPVDCQTIDAARCYEDLQEPAQCFDENWLIPANCYIP